uniref:Cortical cell-delineating protein n=1 Tax=Aegilops tauschii TaxID=37682 RepID=N1R5U3_AEGTA
MAPSKLTLFLALSLVLVGTSHGCGSCGNTPSVPVPTPPIALNLGVPASEQCCPLLSGLADLDAAVCLCTAIKANVLGIKLNVPVDLVLLLNQCGKTCPADFTCPS